MTPEIGTLISSGWDTGTATFASPADAGLHNAKGPPAMRKSSLATAAVLSVGASVVAAFPAAVPASATGTASSDYYGSCPGFPSGATKNDPATVTPGPADLAWPIPTPTDVVTPGSPSGPIATNIHVDAPSLTMAAFQHSAHASGMADVFCNAHGDFTNTLTVGPGMSGLAIGDPVTVVATIGINGGLSFRNDGTTGFYADADANAYFRVVDPATYSRLVDYTADGYLIATGGSGGRIEMQSKHDLYLSSNTTPTTQETPAEVDAVLAQWPWPTITQASPVDFGSDIGIRTVTFATTVGATLDVTGSFQIDNDAQVGLVGATSDLRNVNASFAADPANPGISLTLQTSPPAIAPTTTTVSTPQPSYVHGAPVTLTAQVASSNGVPTGTVTFSDDNGSLGTAQLDSTGHAQLTMGPGGYLSLGAHAITAGYAGTNDYAPSSGTTNVTVTRATATVTVTPPAAMTAGQTSTLGVTVTTDAPSTDTPVGPVSWWIDGEARPQGALTSGAVLLSVPGLTAGPHVIAVCYSGDAFIRDNCPPEFTVTVAKSGTTTKISASAMPSVPSRNEVLTANVRSASGQAVPTGTVTFRDGTAVLGTSTVINGVALLSLPGKTLAGSHVVTATYNGDTSYFGSSAQLKFPKS